MKCGLSCWFNSKESCLSQQARYLVLEDPTGQGATKPVCKSHAFQRVLYSLGTATTEARTA